MTTSVLWLCVACRLKLVVGRSSHSRLSSAYVCSFEDHSARTTTTTTHSVITLQIYSIMLLRTSQSHVKRALSVSVQRRALTQQVSVAQCASSEHCAVQVFGCLHYACWVEVLPCVVGVHRVLDTEAGVHHCEELNLVDCLLNMYVV